MAWQDDHDCEMDAIDIVDHDLFEETFFGFLDAHHDRQKLEAGEVHRLDLSP